MGAELEALHQAIDGCYECSKRGVGISKVRGVLRGDERARVMMIGQAPGKAAAKSKRAFAGHSIHALRRWFAEAGYSLDEPSFRSRVYLTSIVKCGAVPDSTSVRRAMWTYCSSFLQRQISFVRPDLIATLGAEAARYLLPPMTSFEDEVGATFNTFEINPTLPRAE